MLPIIIGFFGVVIGFLVSPNPTVAVICGGFFAVVAWAVTGFKLVDVNSNNKSSDQHQSQVLENSVAAPPSTVTQTTNTPSLSEIPLDQEANRRWQGFKIKVFLVVIALIFAANFERCTETPQERYQKDMLSTQRLQNLAKESVYDDCQASEQECRASAQRAEELASKKAKIMYGK
jgi:hypothetical protein